MPTPTFDHTHFIPNGDHDIPARVEKPAVATPDNPVPAVVMLHGTGTQKDEVAGSYKRLARLLARVGIASIRIDFLGHGESAGQEKTSTSPTLVISLIFAMPYGFVLF